MVMSRLIPTLRHSLVLDSITEDHTLVQLISFATEDLLPRSMTLWAVIPTFSLQFSAAKLNFCGFNKNVNASLVKIDP